MKVNADRSYSEGEVVSISYGLKSSAECLEDHGIVPELVDEDSSCEIILQIDENDKFPDGDILICFFRVQ